MSEICPICERSFATAADLVAHSNHRHRGAGPDASLLANPEAHRPGLVCSLCGQRFPRPEDLAEHNQRPHPKSTRRWLGAARA